MTDQDKTNETSQENQENQENKTSQENEETHPFYKQNYFLVGSGIGILVATSALCYSKYKN